MKAFAILSSTVFIGLACMPPAIAGTLQIDPQPLLPKDIAAPDVSAEAPAPVVAPAAVEAAVAHRVVDPSYFHVPQPGDPYFDPPGSERVGEAADNKVFEPDPVYSQQPGAETAVAAMSALPVAEPMPVPEPASEMAEEPLQVRMSESYEDMIADTVPSSGDAAVEVVAPPARPVQDSGPMSEAEKITWYSDPVPVQSHAPEAAVAGSAEWTAMEGDNIRQVLEQWGRKAGVKTVWDSQDSFAVLKAMDVQTSYEVAVEKLLDQYQDNQVRPLATLHIDPETRVKTLVVEVKEGV